MIDLCTNTTETLRTPHGVLIEGSFHDAWRHHYVVERRFLIPEDCARIIIGSYTLTRIGQWEDGGMKLSDQPDESGSQVDLGYGIIFRDLERPTTLIVEDGRIYHDLDLRGPNDPNNTRLEHFIELLTKEGVKTNPVVELPPQFLLAARS